MNESLVKKLAGKIESVNGLVMIASEDLDAFAAELSWLYEKIEDYRYRDEKEGRRTILGTFAHENTVKMRNLSNLAKYLNQRLKMASEELDQLTHEANEETWNDQK